MMKLLLMLAFVLVCGAACAQHPPHTRTGDFVDFPMFPSTVLRNARAVSVFLPPSYKTDAARRYPVLYAQDGQNVFDARTSFIGKEWELDETLARLWKQKAVPEIIVVGIANTADRMKEYSPGPSGDGYIRFLTMELKPFIDNRFRTMRGPENAAMLGSSLGALISLWAAVTRPDVFGQAAGLSISLPYGGPLLDRLTASGHPKVRVYMDMGTAELGPGDRSARLVTEFRDAAKRLEAAGYTSGHDLAATVIEGGIHNEASWAARVETPLRFLFANRAPR
jgi:predicted alpha/beta superfamily hydrolase